MVFFPPKSFLHSTAISMSHTMSFVYHLPLGCNQSSCSHPGCLSILKNSPMSLCRTRRAGCGGNEDKEKCLFCWHMSCATCCWQDTEPRSVVCFRYCLQAASTVLNAIWQSPHKATWTPTQHKQIWPLHSSSVLSVHCLTTLNYPIWANASVICVFIQNILL